MLSLFARRYCMKKNNIKLNILGFTIIELLAMIALLSIIVSIIIYFIIDIVNNANKKSYEVTVKNIEIEVVNYISEDIRKSSWITDNEKKISISMCNCTRFD